ncbi:MAG TPA: alpha/beta hydrolase, partial [Archangium sp.]
ALTACTKLRDFDHLVTARHFGFSSAEDYYAKCSAGPQLKNVRTRTLLLSADDDALAPPLIPDSAKQQENLDVLVTKSGGHVGFVGGSVFRPIFWAEARVLCWLEERAR